MAKGEGVINNGKKNEEAKNYGTRPESRQGKRTERHDEIRKDEPGCAESRTRVNSTWLGIRRQISQHAQTEI